MKKIKILHTTNFISQPMSFDCVADQKCVRDENLATG